MAESRRLHNALRAQRDRVLGKPVRAQWSNEKGLWEAGTRIAWMRVGAEQTARMLSVAASTSLGTLDHEHMPSTGQARVVVVHMDGWTMEVILSHPTPQRMHHQQERWLWTRLNGKSHQCKRT